MNATEVVDFALTYARREFHMGRISSFEFGCATGQLIVAEHDMKAPAYLVQGALNEVGYLYRRSRGVR